MKAAIEGLIFVAGDEGITKLCEYLFNNTALTSLYLQHKFQNMEFVIMKEQLPIFTKNNIGDEGANKLSEALCKNSSILVLWLSCMFLKVVLIIL